MTFLCLLCSKATLHTIDEFSALPRVTSDARPFPAGGKLAVCKSCGAIQKLPDATFLDEIEQIYASYSLYELAEGTEQVIFIGGVPRRRSEILLDLLQERAKLGTVIDVGCGNGAALRSLSQRRPDARLWGSELSDRNEASLSKIPNFQRLFTSRLDEIPLRFDTLTLIHVLEHVLDPVQFLSDCGNLLEPEGSMLVDVPDIETSPFDLIIADHLTHFSTITLGNALDRAGLRSSLLTNQVLPKEVTALAGVGPAVTEPRADEDGLRRATSIVRWLSSVLAHARGLPTDRPIGIFGTSMAGMWLYGAIKDRVSFFVDEDEAKIGHSFDGLPIVHPKDAPSNVRVLVPLVMPVAKGIAKRWTSADQDYVALGSDAETLEV